MDRKKIILDYNPKGNTWCKDFYEHLKETREMRTLSEILIEADATRHISDLQRLAEEIIANKYKMPLCEVLYGLEHIKELGLILKQIDEVKQLMS